MDAVTVGCLNQDKMKENLRYCHTCCGVTLFSINKSINHSECTKCGCRFGIKKKSAIITQLNKTLFEKIRQMEQKDINIKSINKLMEWYNKNKELVK